jgi:SAM-dependent methyltransferase
MKEQGNLKVAGDLKEDGIVIGNTYDKYGSRNPIIKLMMQGYERSLNKLVNNVNPTMIHEVGCGEGYWTLKWLEKGIDAHGSDFSNTVINMAQSNANDRKLPSDNFLVRNIYDLEPAYDTANLVVCCQVLEHLDKPEDALLALKRIADPYLIVCIPREPLWSVLNMARGKYWNEWGNTPGHIQRWSKRGFIKLVSIHFDIVNINTPVPWTMLLCKKRNNI